MTATMKQRLDPRVVDLHTRGRLSAFDCEWIANLPKESQLAAAEKCIRGNLSFGIEERTFKGKGSMHL